MLIAQTPLRVSLAGGPTDLSQYSREHGGEVVGFGIDKYLFVWVKERFDRKIVINWTHKEIVDDISQIQHELVREAARMAGLRDGFDVITTADIPSEGSGLGSSSALTVALLNAFFQFRGLQLATAELAQRACRIEIEVLGKPIGRQDQYLTAFGGLHHATFARDGRVEMRPVSLSTETLRLLNQNLLLFYTGTTRKASGILAGHVEHMGTRLDHYHHMKKLVPKLLSALESGRVDEVGPILDEGWNIKKRLAAGVTLPAIDDMYATALRAGATGGKLCGAGGGGFLLVYCPLQAQESLRQSMKAYAEMPFQIEQDGTKVIFSARRPMWKTIV